MGILSIVVGMDGSEPSVHALSFSVGLAVREHARLSVCFVSHQTVVFPVGLLPVDDDEWATALEKMVGDELARAEVDGSFVRRDGEVVRELKRLADERAADVIVVGRSRHPHLHLGSVPRRLLDVGGRAVLVVP